jgi:serine/threonine protein kinase
MLRASTAHEALLDVNPTPRTTTLARRLKAGSFLSLTPKDRLRELEYPRGSICLVRDLWETNFGPVHVGEASGLEGNDALTTVFIKSLRNRASAKLRQQFRIEMTWASGFSHPNIISLLGVCVKEEPYYMLYEHLEYGSLKEFLQTVSSMWFDFDQFLGETTGSESIAGGGDSLLFEEGPNQSMFGVEDLTSMACQVADGMDYLAKKAFILKDLATRNCQVT